MRFLLTNDDGIDAPGLAALRQSVADLGEPLLVAPDEHHSGCSHRVTTDKPLRLQQRDTGIYALAGTPADCVRVGLHGIAPDVDWVLSGINHGGNLGADVHYSGTVAAVREGVLHGKPGIAFSHYMKRGLELDWSRASEWVRRVTLELLALPWETSTFWNVNLPHLAATEPDPQIIYCGLDQQPLPLAYDVKDGHFHYAGDYSARPRDPKRDVDICFSGNIAVTRLSLLQV